MSIQQSLSKWLNKDVKGRATLVIGELKMAIGSHVGLKRPENQDRVVIIRATIGEPFVAAILCDGMGGMKDGACCASLAITSFLTSCLGNTTSTLQDKLIKAAHTANKTVYDKYRGRGGTTLSALFISNSGEIAAVNIGDSRIYSLSNLGITQLTVDDTLAGQVISNENPKYLNKDLLQYVGIGEGLIPHSVEFPSEIDTILLTSDGTHIVGSEALFNLVQNAPDIGSASRRLIETSIWYGGNDNASVIAIDKKDLIPAELFIDEFKGIEIWDTTGLMCITHDESVNAPASATEKSVQGKKWHSPFKGDKKKSKTEHLKSSTEQQSLTSGDPDSNTESSTGASKDQKKVEKVEPQLKIDFE